MKQSFLVIGLILINFAALAQQPPVRICSEMDSAANAIARINGATFVRPAYRLPETPFKTNKGYAFSYSFAAYASEGDELPTKKVGSVHVSALIKNGEAKCKVLTVDYVE